MQIVKFKNGMFGVRRRAWWSEYQYADLTNYSIWWLRGSRYFKTNCQTSDLDLVKEVYHSYTDRGTPYKPVARYVHTESSLEDE